MCWLIMQIKRFRTKGYRSCVCRFCNGFLTLRQHLIVWLRALFSGLKRSSFFLCTELGYNTYTYLNVACSILWMASIHLWPSTTFSSSKFIPTNYLTFTFYFRTSLIYYRCFQCPSHCCCSQKFPPTNWWWVCYKVISLPYHCCGLIHADKEWKV